jgi:GrpB-like predicted nucleotidyltransferase (UPF0157 family)
MTIDIDEPVVILEYNDQWPVWYRDDAQQISAALGSDVREIRHVGSTSIPDLAAKPIIDILLAPTVWPLKEQTTRALGNLGYESVASSAAPRCVFGAALPDRQYFTRRRPRRTNIVCVEWHGRAWNDIVVLNDYLRANPAAARSYGEVKKRNFASGATSLVAYSEQKYNTIGELLVAAKRWSRERSDAEQAGRRDDGR